jgi:hypothetical protein
MSNDAPGLESASAASAPLPCPAAGSDEASSAALPRSWWRCHVSTWVAGGVLVGAVLLLNLSAFRRFEPIPISATHWHYGWPRTYLRCDFEVDPITGTPLGVWTFGTRVVEIAWWPLVGNVWVGVGLVTVVVGLVEWRRRRRTTAFQFSLRQSAMTVAIIAAMLAAWRQELAAHQRRRAVLAELGQSHIGGWGQDHRAPVWLRACLGDKWLAPFDKQSQMAASAPPPGADPTKVALMVAEFPEIRSLECWNSSDELLVSIGQLRDLEWLDCGNSPRLTDDGLRHLSELKGLRELRIENCPRITDDGLAAVTNLRRLECLHIGSNQLAGQALLHLRGMQRLRELWVDHTRVDDNGLKAIGELADLEWLSLVDTDITDAGLVNLKGLSKLKRLDLRGTYVTQGGAKDIQAILPFAKVVWQPRP